MYFIHALQIFVQIFIMTTRIGESYNVGGPLDSTITVINARLLRYDLH